MTRKNRRNFFRILYVQPDAPPAIIKASYRTLMGPLKQHPDLGGDHENASLINEAYDVLSDPVRREAYARTYRVAWTRAPAADAKSEPASDPFTWAKHRTCPFCGTKLPRSINVDTRCDRCACSLAQPVKHATRGRELLGRRSGQRIAKGDPAILYPNWRANPVAVRLRDISLGGLSLYAGVALPVGQPIRIVGARLDAVALIVSTRRQQHEWLINTRLLTVRFAQKAGVFVSDVA
ncbi:MAG: DnaJ domain-containing protein [Burkholderiales bacterium]